MAQLTRIFQEFNKSYETRKRHFWLTDDIDSGNGIDYNLNGKKITKLGKEKLFTMVVDFSKSNGELLNFLFVFISNGTKSAEVKKDINFRDEMKIDPYALG